MQRRSFLTTGLVLPSALATAGQLTASSFSPHQGKFKISLKADAIGVEGSAEALLTAASKHGFEALSVPAESLMGWQADQLKSFAKKADKMKVAWGATVMPVDFRRTEAQFKSNLAALPMYAKNLASIGVTRMGTWIVSGHDTLTYNENMRQHADRLRDCARILGKEGIRLGLEYLGTPSIRRDARFAFISTGKETKELIEMIDEPNVGVVLDSYHWYTAEETVDELMIWKNEEIIAVDLNDANNQLTVLQQTDIARELPGATGMIDLDGFLQALVKLGYDGPLRAEPFSRTLNQMEDDLALAATYAAIKGSIDKALGAK